MRAGETDKAVSFKDEKLFDLIKEFVNRAGYRGQIDIDIFDINGDYYISEVNPRFGGGYPLSYNCGGNFPELLIREYFMGESVDYFDNWKDGMLMLRYDDAIYV